MELDYTKIKEYFQKVDDAPAISLLMGGIEQLSLHLKGIVIPQFEEMVLGGYDPGTDYKFDYGQGAIYNFENATYTSSHLLAFFGRTTHLPQRDIEKEVRRCVDRIESDRNNRGEVGPEFADYRLRRTAFHTIWEAEKEMSEIVSQTKLDPLVALLDCSSHLQTSEKSLYLAKVLLEARIEEMKKK